VSTITLSAASLPIVCAWCERIRTESGSWVQATLAELTSTRATHGICPECFTAEKRAATSEER
jgi:hypothetical protein